jgi:hypothetical protein
MAPGMMILVRFMSLLRVLFLMLRQTHVSASISMGLTAVNRDPDGRKVTRRIETEQDE